MNKIYKGSLLILMAAALLFSCKKDISKIGVDVVGNNPLEVIHVDTFSVQVYSEVVDSMLTDDLSSNILGVYVDPVFGTINASIYTQFRLDAGNVEYEFEEGAVFDSVVMYLAYNENGVYGDSTFQQHIHVYELGEEMVKGDDYYSFNNLKTTLNVLADVQFVPSFDSIDYYDISDSDTIESGTKLKELRIPLTDEFGNRLMAYEPEDFADDETFLDLFKGVQITTLDENRPSSGGSLMDINFLSDDTRITLYYSYPDVTDEGADTTIQVEFDLVSNSNNARFSNFQHYDYLDASPEFRSQVIDGNIEDGIDQIYLQSLAGVTTVIKFPYLGKMDDYYKYAVNEAKLFLYNIDEESGLDPIESLTLSQKVEVNIDEDSTVVNEYTIPDASSGDIYFGGNYLSSTDNYTFRITQYIQDLIHGYTYDNQMRFEIIGGAVNANRLVAGGSDPFDETKRIKLQVIYTKIEDE